MDRAYNRPDTQLHIDDGKKHKSRMQALSKLLLSKDILTWLSYCSYRYLRFTIKVKAFECR